MFVTVLEQAIQSFGKWNQIVFGLLIVLVVMFFRGGLWGIVEWAGRALAGGGRLAQANDELAQ
jgi:ABC-type branched-subunit amino acid transport system permease subunit